MQKLAQLRTTANSDDEYLWNGWKYSKLDKYFIYHNSSCIDPSKKSNYGQLTTQI